MLRGGSRARGPDCKALGMPDHAIPANDVTLALSDDGAGIPVVLLHGLTASRHYVVMGSQTLQRGGHRVVAYDARGHGASSPAPVPEAYRYEELTADLAAVLDALGIERAVLAGASMGAHTALRLALEQPERVAAIAVITPGYDPVEFDDPQRLARWDALADALRAVPRSRPFEDLHALEEIECPAVVVASRDEADPGHPLALGEAYAELLPRGRLLVEEPGSSPLAWQGGRLSKVIAELATQADLAPL
jgi:pimeloyl-ACP methyl ester carboxylesterase